MNIKVMLFGVKVDKLKTCRYHIGMLKVGYDRVKEWQLAVNFLIQ